MALNTIKNRKDFLLLNTNGKKFITHSIILQVIKRADTHRTPASEIRIGFTVTKKMGNAVVRNRIKRRLREAVRPALAKHAINGHDFVLISRQKALTCEFTELLRDIDFAFRKIVKL